MAGRCMEGVNQYQPSSALSYGYACPCKCLPYGSIFLLDDLKSRQSVSTHNPPVPLHIAVTSPWLANTSWKVGVNALLSFTGLAPTVSHYDQVAIVVLYRNTISENPVAGVVGLGLGEENKNIYNHR